MSTKLRLGLVLAAGLAVSHARAQTCPTLRASDVPWRTMPGMEVEEETTNISGAACALPGGRGTCLLIGDEKRYARLFTLDGTKLVPGERVTLLPKRAGGREFKETDGEAVAYDAGYYYIAGSHGMPRTPGKPRQASRYFVYRVPVDPATGRPGFPHDGDDPAPEVRRSGGLSAIVEGVAALRLYLNRPLDEHGINVEGLAARDGVLHVGFRGPVLGGQAHVLSVRASRLFGGEPGAADPGTVRLTRLTLGEGMGIRDLAAVPGGFLVLSGPEQDVDGPADVFFWTGPGSGAATCLGRLGADRGRGVKPEALLVLDSGPDGTRVLVLHDGEEGGKPTEYRLPRP